MRGRWRCCGRVRGGPTSLRSTKSCAPRPAPPVQRGTSRRAAHRPAVPRRVLLVAYPLRRSSATAAPAPKRQRRARPVGDGRAVARRAARGRTRRHLGEVVARGTPADRRAAALAGGDRSARAADQGRGRVLRRVLRVAPRPVGGRGAAARVARARAAIEMAGRAGDGAPGTSRRGRRLRPAGAPPARRPRHRPLPVARRPVAGPAGRAGHRGGRRAPRREADAPRAVTTARMRVELTLPGLGRVQRASACAATR